MKTIKTSELKGAALDWAVAKADGKTPKIDCVSFQDAFIYRIYLGWSYEYSSNGSIVKYTPSTDWSQGGPIIEREMIQLTPHCMVNPLHGWAASFRSFDEDDDVDALHGMRGKTPLLAAMRCYVVSKFGKRVEIPEELL